VVYDLLNGGQVQVRDSETPGYGQARIELAAGDGAMWVHLPEEVGPMELAARALETNEIDVQVRWGNGAALPIRVRLIDPDGQEVLDLFRATSPQAQGEATGASVFAAVFPLGRNAQPGTWTV